MKILNVHERAMKLVPDLVATSIDNLSGENDILWPSDKWPPMELDSTLCVGAEGGHGVVRYSLTEYIPGRRVVFQFNGLGITAGLDGRHFFEVVARRDHTVLRHVIDAECDLKNWLMWHLLIGPLHDALLEDGLDRAENHMIPGACKSSHWGPRVKLLRWVVRRKSRAE